MSYKIHICSEHKSFVKINFIRDGHNSVWRSKCMSISGARSHTLCVFALSFYVERIRSENCICFLFAKQNTKKRDAIRTVFDSSVVVVNS